MNPINIDEFSSIPTINGSIQIEDIPLVEPQTPLTTFTKVTITFGILILCILLYFWVNRKQDKVEAFMTPDQPQMDGKIQSHVKANSIDVISPKQFENIIIISNSGPTYNIDVNKNPFVVNYKIKDSQVSSLEFENEIDVKQIVLWSNRYNIIHQVVIKLYDANKNVVWNYAGKLKPRYENSINISKLVYIYCPEKSEKMPDFRKAQDINSEEKFLRKKLY